MDPNAAVQWLQHLDALYIYMILFGVLLACGFGVPIPEDITLFAGGLLAYGGSVDLVVVIIVCFMGVMIGDGIMFFAGNKYGRILIKKPWFQKLIKPEQIESIQNQLHNHRFKVLFTARFMPGLRSPVFFSAGTLHLPYWTFLLCDGFAALISVPTIVILVYSLGDEVVHIIKSVEHGIGITIFAVIALIVGKLLWNRRKARLAAQKAASDNQP